MFRQSNRQTYVKVFNYIIPPHLSIPNVPDSPYYNYYIPTIKLIEPNNNTNLIYGNK